MGAKILVIFSETTMARRVSTCKQNGTWRWRLGIGLMTSVGRPLDPYDKVMKEKTYGWSSAWLSLGASMPDKHIMCQMN